MRYKIYSLISSSKLLFSSERVFKMKSVFFTEYYNLLTLFYKKPIMVYYSSKFNNFGDVLNKYLLNKLSPKKIIQIDFPQYCKQRHIFFIGSVIQESSADTIICGSGIISLDSSIKKPKKILSVRGPLTRNVLLANKIDCPEIYGDPALLLPILYSPKVEKKYKIGVIPHYEDFENELLDLFNEKDIIIIDVKTKNIEGFVDLVNQCDCIFSSSLHGIIVADVYGIPSLWISFSNKVIGDGFKFRDYFMSVQKNVDSPIKINSKSSINELMPKICYDKIKFNKIRYHKFIKEFLKSEY